MMEEEDTKHHHVGLHIHVNRMHRNHQDSAVTLWHTDVRHYLMSKGL